jgi:DNA polymerase alpha subunit B
MRSFYCIMRYAGVAIAKNHSFSASQMATTWETYSLNHNADTLSRHTFASFRSALLSNSAANKSRSSDKKGSVSPTPTIRGAVLNRPAMGKRSYPKNGIQSPSTKRKIGSEDVKVESPITANAATSDFSPQVSSSSRAIVTPSKTIIKQPNQSKAYGNRTNSGQVMITYNPKKLNPITSSTSKVEITKPYGIVEEYKYMTDNDRSSALNSHLVNFQTEICSQNKIKTENGGEEIDEEDEPTLEHIGVPHPTTQINIGRICNEAHEGKMNKTSILLEGSKNGSNGARISLDVSRMKNESFSLFSGQIVGIKGVNSSGRKIVVEEFIEGLQTKLVKSNKDDLRKMYEGTDGNGTKMYAVAGPYTTNQDLKYEPLIDLLNLIVREKPAVVIMMGPFIDSRQALLKEGDEVVLEYEQDESEGGGAVRRHVSYETLFAAKISQELEDLYTEFPELKTKFVLVPSLDDAISEPV